MRVADILKFEAFHNAVIVIYDTDGTTILYDNTPERLGELDYAWGLLSETEIYEAEIVDIKEICFVQRIRKITAVHSIDGYFKTQDMLPRLKIIIEGEKNRVPKYGI